MAATGGIGHTGIGPFAIEPGTLLAYGRMNYQRGDFKLSFFTNILDGEAPALLAIDPDDQPINFIFKSQTYDVEFANLHLLGGQHLLSYGGNLRHNAFDLSLAPLSDKRDEVGFYVQDEIYLSDHFRWVVGGRVDRFDILDRVVFSPRTSFMVKPWPNTTFRVSYDRAFRAPSLVNHFMETVILNDFDLGSVDPSFEGEPFFFRSDALGNEALREESLTAYELSFTGVLRDRVTLSAAVYVNELENLIDFAQTKMYNSKNVPDGWPLPPSVLDELVEKKRGLPAESTFINLEKVRDKGMELSLQARINVDVNVFANYSWQDDPEPVKLEDESALNLPPTHRFNAGLDFTHGRYFGNVVVNYTDDAYWQDVLDVRFHGPTEAYTLVNAGFGIRWEEEKLTTAIKVTNLTNAEIQQHVFGDVIKRLIVGELRFRF
jgi:outer membrane receptor protein involved in Fe transport